VADGSGSGTYSVQVVVYNPAPTVGPVSAPASVGVGSAVSASATYVSTGLVPADTCTVDYGDGSGFRDSTVRRWPETVQGKGLHGEDRHGVGDLAAADHGHHLRKRHPAQPQLLRAFRR
jgi:hypothetical protein